MQHIFLLHLAFGTGQDDSDIAGTVVRFERGKIRAKFLSQPDIVGHPCDVRHFEDYIRTGEHHTIPREYIRRIDFLGGNRLVDLFQISVVTDRLFRRFKIIAECGSFLVIAVSAQIKPVHIKRKDSRHHFRVVVPHFECVFADQMIHLRRLRAAQEVE